MCACVLHLIVVPLPFTVQAAAATTTTTTTTNNNNNNKQ
jgi:hypothetical protein